MKRKLFAMGAVVTAFAASASPAIAAGTSHSGGANCLVVASACRVTGQHSTAGQTNWCTVSNGIYASCQVTHSCSLGAYGTLATGTLTCGYATPPSTTCSASTAGFCSAYLYGSTTIAFNTCATFAIDAKSTSPVGGTAQWTDSITMCVDPNTGPYVL